MKVKSGQGEPAKGQAVAEYILIICLMAVICLGGTRIFGAVLNKYYERLTLIFTVPLP
jgi:Flp pilus assembly pilin Flp